MAVLRVQENIKKADGAYDVVHKETEAGLVLFDDNETFQQKYDAGELNGQNGKSAYQQAVEGGYTGTEAEFKAMLASGPWLRTAGGSLSGNLTVGNVVISTYGGISSNVSYGLEIASAVNFVDGFTTDSDVPIHFNGSKLQGVDAPIQDTDAANKKYVDDKFSGASGGSSAVTYGACLTSASIAAKVVTASGFTLKTGAEIWVKFTNYNTASTPTLNVNSTGAKAIKKYGTTSPNTYMWASGAVVGFVYDGSYWIMVNGTTATTTNYGVTKLNDSVFSTSTGEAATSNAVRQAYNVAIEAKSLTDRPIPLAPEMYWPISGSHGHPDFDEVLTYVKAKFYGGNEVFFDIENEYAMEQYVNGIRIWCPPGYYFLDEGCGAGVSLIINGAYYSMEIVSEGGRNYLYSSVSYGYGFNFHVSGAVAIRPNLAKF